MRSKGSQLNASDVVEVGCHSAANKAVGRRSTQNVPSGVWDDLKQSATQPARASTAHGAAPTPTISQMRVAGLKQMFPNLEERVIVMVIQEARSEEATIDTLLTLAAPAAATSRAVSEEVQALPAPPQEQPEPAAPVEPTTGDQGWMVCSSLDLDDLALSEADSTDRREVEGSQTGLSWSDRAKAAASLSAPPVPRKAPRAAVSETKTANARTSCPIIDESLELLALPPLTEYELDQKESLKRQYLHTRSCRGRRFAERQQQRSGCIEAVGDLLLQEEPQQVLA